MTCLLSADAFQSIEIDSVKCGIPELELFGVGLADVRDRLSLGHGNVFEANAWWRGLIEESRRRPDPWRYAALWACVPRLRSMMWEIYRVTGLGLDECRSELILGALEALGCIDFSAEDIGKGFMTRAARGAWDLGRGQMRVFMELGWDGDELLSIPDEMPLPPKKIDRILDARKLLLTPRQLTGERFGAIAAKLGMIDSLCPPEQGGRRLPIDFIKLFGLPQFVSLKTAALIYGISLKTAYQRIRDRRLPFAVFRDGKVYRVPTASLAASMGICMEGIDFEDVLSGAYSADQSYESPGEDDDDLDESDPFSGI